MTTTRTTRHHAFAAPTMTEPSSPANTNNADKARQDEQTAKAAAYSSKTATPSGLPIDNQERVALGTIVATLNDDIAALSGGHRFDGAGSGGLQQPKVAK
jgi:hypothetical protein